MYDFIGDIHGHADKLEALLKKLGYEAKNGSYTHPERKAFFIGDYIDRGPKIRKSLKLVRAMVENDKAIALMGNHEYNALCFHFQEKEGGHLRRHEIKNIIQHFKTLKQFQNRQKEYEDYLDWFKTLPLFYEADQFRAVHACWDEKSIKYLKKELLKDRLTDDLIYKSVTKGSNFYRAVDITLKGKEITMPNGFSFTDKDRNTRHEIRIKWWEDPAHSTYKKISIETLETLPEIPIEFSNLPDASFYDETEKPVFFGHYWLKGNPRLYRSNICCLDYSVAKKGKLVAYQFRGENVLSNKKFVLV